MGFGEFTFKEQLVLADAIIKKECFIAGYRKPVFTARHFMSNLRDLLLQSRHMYLIIGEDKTE